MNKLFKCKKYSEKAVVACTCTSSILVVQVLWNILAMLLECCLWIQRLMVQTQASVHCVLEQDTLSMLL